MQVIGCSASQWGEVGGQVDAAASQAAPFLVFSSGHDVVCVVGTPADSPADLLRFARVIVPELSE